LIYDGSGFKDIVCPFNRGSDLLPCSNDLVMEPIEGLGERHKHKYVDGHGAMLGQV